MADKESLSHFCRIERALRLTNSACAAIAGWIESRLGPSHRRVRPLGSFKDRLEGAGCPCQLDLDRADTVSRVLTGDRITYGRPGVRGRLAVGLWAYPAPLDFDSDGNMDLIAGCPDRPYNGIYLFRNLRTNADSLYDRAEWLGPGGKDLVAADFNGDGATDLVVSGGYYSDVRKNRLSRFVRVELPRKYHVGRDDLWHPVD
jgi:hypothetical protein